jgi:hypothetical protein
MRPRSRPDQEDPLIQIRRRHRPASIQRRRLHACRHQRRDAARANALGEPIPDHKAAANGNDAKSAVARPEERKFLGFSISNDGAERRIAPKALDTFKTRVREQTCRTRGLSLTQIVEELTPYFIAWRGYFGFCQTPRVLTNLEAWTRRRLRSYLWRQWGNGHNRFNELRCRGVSQFRPVHQRASGACQGTRRSKRPCATTTLIHSASPDSTFRSRLNPVEPPWYETRMPGGVGGAAP